MHFIDVLRSVTFDCQIWIDILVYQVFLYLIFVHIFLLDNSCLYSVPIDLDAIRRSALLLTLNGISESGSAYFKMPISFAKFDSE